VSKLGKWKVEAVSKCRSQVSKRAKRRFAWVLLRAKDVEAVEAGPRRLSKLMSKRCRSAPTSTTEPDLRVGGPIETAAIEGWRIVLKPPPAVDRPHCRYASRAAGLVPALRRTAPLTCSSLPQSRADQAVRTRDVSCSVPWLPGFPDLVGTLPQCGKLQR
jgi:hypothetical protein